MFTRPELCVEAEQRMRMHTCMRVQATRERMHTCKRVLHLVQFQHLDEVLAGCHLGHVYPLQRGSDKERDASGKFGIEGAGGYLVRVASVNVLHEFDYAVD